MQDWACCSDEGANHQLPIGEASWIIWIVSMEECSSLTQNWMQTCCSTRSVILNVMATQTHAHSTASTASADCSEAIIVHTCTFSPLSLAARSHRGHAHHSHYIDNDWAFSRQTFIYPIHKYVKYICIWCTHTHILIYVIITYTRISKLAHPEGKDVHIGDICCCGTNGRNGRMEKNDLKWESSYLVLLRDRTTSVWVRRVLKANASQGWEGCQPLSLPRVLHLPEKSLWNSSYLVFCIFSVKSYTEAANNYFLWR